MENNKEHNSIKSNILDKIKDGHTSMRPRWYFVFESIALAMAVFLVSLVLLGLISFIFFMLRQSGAMFAPGFGGMGFGIFARAMPWMLILFGVSLFVILEILMKNYAFAYRKPVFYSLVILFFFFVSGSLLVHFAQFHERAYNYAVGHRMPVFGPMYLNYGRSENREIHPGIVTLPIENGFYMVKRSGKEVHVIFIEKTMFPRGRAFIAGDNVVVLGEEEGGRIEAFGVRKVEENFAPMHRGMMNFQIYAPAP